MTPKILEPQCAWHSDEVSDESAFTETFEGAELEEIDGALRAAMEKSEDVLEIGREDFPIPGLSTRLAGVERELIEGRGFVRLRGLDRDRYSQPEMEMIYWGIGAHLGPPWPQNK